jgi:hypothetical protein
MLFPKSWVLALTFIYKLYLKSYCMYRKIRKGGTMADTGTGQILVTKVISPIQSYDRGTDSLYEEVGHLSRERTLSVGRSMRERGGEQESAQSKMIVVIEQWICLVLGFICMAFGMWGICMKPGQDALSEHLAWLGSLYMPTLRATAVVCTGLGVMLIRWGWAHP